MVVRYDDGMICCYVSEEYEEGLRGMILNLVPSIRIIRYNTLVYRMHQVWYYIFSEHELALLHDILRYYDVHRGIMQLKCNA